MGQFQHFHLEGIFWHFYYFLVFKYPLGAGIVVQQLKLPTSHVGVPILVLAPQLLIQFPGNAPGKAMDDGTWVPAIHLEDPVEVPSS